MIYWKKYGNLYVRYVYYFMAINGIALIFRSVHYSHHGVCGCVCGNDFVCVN